VLCDYCCPIWPGNLPARSHPFASPRQLRFPALRSRPPLAPSSHQSFPWWDYFRGSRRWPGKFCAAAGCFDAAAAVWVVAGSNNPLCVQGNSFSLTNSFHSTYFQLAQKLFTPVSPLALAFWWAAPARADSRDRPSSWGPRTSTSVTPPSPGQPWSRIPCLRQSIQEFRTSLYFIRWHARAPVEICGPFRGSSGIGSRQAAAAEPYGSFQT